MTAPEERNEGSLRRIQRNEGRLRRTGRNEGGLRRSGMVLGRGVPAWWLRVAVALTGVLVVALPGELGVIGVLAGLGVLASVYAPDSPAPAVVVLCGAGMLLLVGGDPLRPSVLAMIPAAHAFHVLSGIAGVLPVRGRLHPQALRRPAIRFLGVQAVVFALAGFAALLPTGRTPLAVEAAALVGLLAIAVIVLVTQRARSDHSHTPGDGRPTTGSGTMEAWGEARRSGS
jgi:hypothetical protein